MVSAKTKTEWGKETRDSQNAPVLRRWVRYGLHTKVVFKLRLNRGHKLCGYLGKGIPGEGNSKCKGPEAGCVRWARRREWRPMWLEKSE